MSDDLGPRVAKLIATLHREASITKGVDAAAIVREAAFARLKTQLVAMADASLRGLTLPQLAEICELLKDSSVKDPQGNKEGGESPQENVVREAPAERTQPTNGREARPVTPNKAKGRAG